MKNILVMMLVVAVGIIIVPKTALAQASFVPPFNNNKTSSLHFGFGELLYDFDSELFTQNIEVKQDVTIFGGNWEHNVNYGFYHFRLGVMGLGDTELSLGSLTETSTYWKDNQSFSFYVGGGYIFLGEVPLSGFAPAGNVNPDPNNAPKGMMLFFGGGFDFNLYAQSAIYSESGDDYEEVFHVFDFSLVGIGGIRMPQIGFILHVGISMHVLLDWESRETVESGGSTTTSYASDDVDLEISFLGMEVGITYEVPSHPRLRFGLLLKFVNSAMFIFHVGYVF